MLGVIWGSSAYLGDFYNDPRFMSVMMLLGVNFFIIPFNTINGSMLRWDMRYALVSKITMVVSSTGTCLGIIMAYLGFGVYSLVFSGIFSSLFLTLVMAYFAPWKPSFVFSFTNIKKHFMFGLRLHLNNTLNLFANRVDNLLAGKLVGMQLLGIYVKAFSLGRKPISMLGANLYQMFFTALSRIREDSNHSQLMYQKMIMAITFAVYLPLTILILTGDGLIIILYGAKWAEAIIPMKIMAFGSFAGVITMISGAFCDSQNLVRQETKVQILNVLMTITAVIVGSKWGLIGISLGIVIKTFVLFVLIKNILTSGIGIKWRDIGHSIWPNVCAAVGSYFLGILILSTWSVSENLVYLLFVILICSIVYLAIWAVIGMTIKNHTEMQTLFTHFKTMLSKLR